MDRTPPPRSIQRTLPLFLCGILLVVVGSLSWIAYRQLEHALLSGVHDRLQGVHGPLVDLLGRSGETRVRNLEALAERPELAAYLANRDDVTREAASRVLTELAPAATGLYTVELWSAGGECLVGASRSPAGEVAAAPSPGSAVAPACLADPDSHQPPSGHGPIRHQGDAAVFDVFASVGGPPPAGGAGAGDAPAGRLVEVRSFSTGETGALIEGLIGSGAEILIGNVGGGDWSSLVGPASGPPLAATTAAPAHYLDAEGVRRVGTASAIPGTPWLLWIEFPYATVMAPLRTFLQRVSAATVVILLLGGTGAWLVGRQIARPLGELTEAAEAMAGGQYARHVDTTRRDETGRLAAAFNVMAERVEAHHRELEDRVAERTYELESTVRRLRETQEQLVRKEKLAMLGQLASGVGHELRNPLGVMSNAVYYLEMVLADPRTEIKEYLGILRNQIGLSEKIVEDLLDFARIRPPQRELVPLDELVDEQLARIQSPDTVSIRRAFATDLPAAHVDRVQVGQVVLNLLSNAFQAMEEAGGTVTLAGEADGDGRVRLEVSDTGPGIAEDDLERIFEPLVTTRARGIGLGLAVARSLAEANVGALTVRSRVGSGSTFSLELPTSAGEDA